MKTAIVYYSAHHGNTKKLLDAIASAHDVTLVDVTKNPEADLAGYDRIGLASGIYYNGFAKQIVAFAQDRLPEGKDVFFIYTHGAPKVDALKEPRRILEQKRCREIGAWGCRGFDTFGPFKIVGGIAKGHPTGDEIKEAVAFYAAL